jgi:hypothetical protein
LRLLRGAAPLHGSDGVIGEGKAPLSGTEGVIGEGKAPLYLNFLIP